MEQITSVFTLEYLLNHCWTCAWSRRSVSLDIWDRNFLPGANIVIPLYLFNDTRDKSNFDVKIFVTDLNGKIRDERIISYKDIPPFATKIESFNIVLPLEAGRYILSAELLNRPESVRYPVVSRWEIRAFEPSVPENLMRPQTIVAADDPEIRNFLKTENIKKVQVSDPSPDIIILGRKEWDQIADGNRSFISKIEQSINSGISVILLDTGERYLGQGHPKDKNDLGPIQGVAEKPDTPTRTYELFGGI